MKENNNKLEKAKNILCEITNNCKNNKFDKLANSDLHRAILFKKENNNRKPKFKKYKKGTIVFINFGINIGGEFSKPHFAIVMDNKDNPYKNTLTVVPLTSKKRQNSVDLGKDLIDSILNDTESNIEKQINLTGALIDLLCNPEMDDGIFYNSNKDVQLTLDYLSKKYNNENKKVIQFRTCVEWVNKELNNIKQVKEFYSKFNKTNQ